MRILHIWNTAGVPSVIAKFMDAKLGTHSRVMARRQHDPVGFVDPKMLSPRGPLLFALSCVIEAKQNDLVHVHDWYAILPWLKGVYPSKPLIFTAHSLRFKYNWKRWKKPIGSADVVTVVSSNLLQGAPPGTVLVPNPVDTELFYDRKQHVSGMGVYMEYHALEEAKAYASALGILKVDIVDRWNAPVQYHKMPDLLAGYEYFIDVRRSVRVSSEIIDMVSKNALEALACGCKVVRWDGKVVSGLPEQNRPEHVVGRYHEIYEQVRHLSNGKQEKKPLPKSVSLVSMLNPATSSRMACHQIYLP